MLVAIDAINFAGKTSLILELKRHFSSLGREVVISQEPGATDLGLRIRKMVKENEFPDMTREARALLFCAARTQNLETIIFPALAAGKLVICDRWADSSVSFQGAAEGMDVARVKSANFAALGDFVPELTVILDIDPLVAMGRSANRGGEADYFETMPLECHQRARQAYLDQASEAPGRYLVVDATLSREQVLSIVVAEVERRLASCTPDRNLLSA